jgi:NADPH2:quinone reductase
VAVAIAVGTAQRRRCHMRVIEVSDFGSPEVLRLAERADPVPGPGQVVVRIAAANVNPTDLAARVGHFPRGAVSPPFVPGWDFSGEVVSLDDAPLGLAVGDRVVGMIHWYDENGSVGAYAESVAVDASCVVPLPEGLDSVLAATIPLNALSADQALKLLNLQAPADVLVVGASGGVGSFAVQLALRDGHRVVAVAGRDDEDWLRSLGAQVVIPRDSDLAGIAMVDALVDAVPVGAAAAVAVRDGGAIVTLRGNDAHEPGRGIRKERFLIEADRARLAELVGDVAAGRLRTRVGHVLPLAKAGEAHRLVEAGGVGGKVVLVP